MQAEAATVNLRNLTQHFGVEWAKTNIVPRIVTMHSNANYLHRLTSLHAVKVLAEAMDAETIQAMLIPLVLELAQVYRIAVYLRYTMQWQLTNVVLIVGPRSKHSIQCGKND